MARIGVRIGLSGDPPFPFGLIGRTAGLAAPGRIVRSVFACRSPALDVSADFPISSLGKPRNRS
jgi:hypothetical protein